MFTTKHNHSFIYQTFGEDLWSHNGTHFDGKSLDEDDNWHVENRGIMETKTTRRPRRFIR